MLLFALAVQALPLALTALLPAPAQAQTCKPKPLGNSAGPIQGRAMALDGDTLEIAGQRIRLRGLDAPEMTARFGPQARGAMDDLIEGRAVSCQPIERDCHNRVVARCWIDPQQGVMGDKQDLTEAMLRLGWGTHYRSFSKADPEFSTWDAAEREARKHQRGIWRE